MLETSQLQKNENRKPASNCLRHCFSVKYCHLKRFSSLNSSQMFIVLPAYCVVTCRYSGFDLQYFFSVFIKSRHSTWRSGRYFKAVICRDCEWQSYLCVKSFLNIYVENHHVGCTKQRVSRRYNSKQPWCMESTKETSIHAAKSRTKRLHHFQLIVTSCYSTFIVTNPSIYLQFKLA